MIQYTKGQWISASQDPLCQGVIFASDHSAAALAVVARGVDVAALAVVALGADIDIALTCDRYNRTNICVAALAVEPFLWISLSLYRCFSHMFSVTDLAYLHVGKFYMIKNRALQYKGSASCELNQCDSTASAEASAASCESDQCDFINSIL